MAFLVEVVTIFPEMFSSVLSTSVLGKAIQKGALEVRFTDPRDFTEDKHRSVDDTPYGGGAGMVMRVEPLVQAIEHIEAADVREHSTEKALLQSGEWIRLLVVDLRPSVEDVGGRDGHGGHKLSRLGLRRLMNWLAHCSSIGKR